MNIDLPAAVAVVVTTVIGFTVVRIVVTEFAFVATAGAAVVGCGRVTVLPAGGTGPVVLNVPAFTVRCVEFGRWVFNLRQCLVLAFLDVLHQVDSQVEEPHNCCKTLFLSVGSSDAERNSPMSKARRSAPPAQSNLEGQPRQGREQYGRRMAQVHNRGIAF